MNEQTNQQTDFANQWITKQAAIDALGEKPLVWDDLSDFDLGKAAQWSDDVDAIKALPSAQPQRWIPVSERLPEDSDYHDLWETPYGAVMWCKGTGEIGDGWYYESTKTWCDLWDNGVRDVVAWMPLPEPWEGEKK